MELVPVPFVAQWKDPNHHFHFKPLFFRCQREFSGTLAQALAYHSYLAKDMTL